MSGKALYPSESADWDAHRDAIVYLYLAENKTLKQVRQIMETRFGFKATTRMYSTRLQRWGVKKNYTAAEKDMLVAQTQDALANGDDVGQITLRGQSINFHRVMRHWRTMNRRIDSAPGANSVARVDRIVTNPHVAGPLLRPTPAELLLLHTKAYIRSYTVSCHVGEADDMPPSDFHPFPANQVIASHASAHAEADRFWHDLETAVYLLRIGSMDLGWSTLHVCWRTAEDSLFSQPCTLLRRVLTTLHPHGSLKKLPELAHSILTFIANLSEIKLGASHPLVKICLNVCHDEEGQRTAESTLALMRSLLEENLGLYHEETFQTDISLIKRYSQNGDLEAAGSVAQRLVSNLETSPGQTTRLPQALRKSAHVLKFLRQHDEAIATHKRILALPPHMITEDMMIYTKEDIGELHRLQGDLFMESAYLSEAWLAARNCFGPQKAPTLHIWDKLSASLLEQGIDMADTAVHGH